MGNRDAHLSATKIYPSPSPPPSSRPSSAHVDLTTQPSHDRLPHPSFSRARILDLARLALTALGIGAAAAVVGCEAHGLSVYRSIARLDERFFLPSLWPANGFDLRPTLGLVVGGAVAAGTGLVYVLIGVVPVPARLKLLMILISLSFAILGLAASVFGVAYGSYITTRQGYDHDNIRSWTCRWVDGAADAEKLFANGLADIAAPEGFKRVCREAHVGFSLLAILVCLEAVVVVLTGLCAWVEVRIRRSEQDSLGGDILGEKD